MKTNPELSRARLEKCQKPLAPDADEAVPRGPDLFAAQRDGDVVPVRETIGYRCRADGVVRSQVAERLIGKHDAPAEGVASPVALEHVDVRGRAPELH